MRPSELYGIRDELDAYRFDRAVSTFGVALENALQHASDGAKNTAQANRKRALVLSRWLGSTAGFRSAPKGPTPEATADLDSEKKGSVSL